MNELAKSNDGVGAEASADFPETPDIHSSTDEYATRFAGKSGAWMLAVQERLALGCLRGSGVKTILDVGGGHGQLAHPLVREGYDVTVLGSDAAGEHRIRELTGQGRCRYVVGNLLALPYPDRSFDAVISFRMVTHVVRWPELVRELSRVSRGPVVVDYPTSQGINAIAPALFDAKKKLEKNTRHWRSFRHDEIRGEFQRNGYQLVQQSGQFLFPMVLHRMLKVTALSAALEGTTRALGLNRRWGSPVVACYAR